MPNPYLPLWEYIPDGEPRVFGDRVYVYGSHDQAASDAFCDHKLLCWSASVDDLNHWTCHGHIFHTADDTDHKSDTSAWTDGYLFAPDVVEKDGKFYLYAYIMGAHGCVAVSDRPEGPFKLIDPYRHGEPTTPHEVGYGDGWFVDPGVLVDDDGRVYIVHGNTEIRLTELAKDLSGPAEGGVDCVILRDDRDKVHLGYEGSHFYKINGRYVLTLIHWPKENGRRTEAVFTAEAVDGPYRGGDVFRDDGGYCGQGIAQGGLVDTPDGRWYAVLFQDSGAIGRIPVLVPVTWDETMPVFGENGRLPEDIAITSTRPDYEYAPLYVSDSFAPCSGPLALPWQWNHVPQDELWTILPEGGLAITTGEVCSNVTQVRNTLTQRMLYPTCAAEVTVDTAGLSEGDTAGLCALQGAYLAVGISEEAGRKYLTVTERKEPAAGFGIGGSDTDPPEVTYREEISEDTLTVGIRADFTKMTDTVRAYVRRGNETREIGEPHRMYFRLDHFTGARFGLFVLSTERAGGTAVFRDFRYIS